jgi:hypothetical protein
MKTTKMRKGKDDFLVFAKFCFENLDTRPSMFLKKAYKVDLLRDKFSKSVLYNYFLYSKRYLKERPVRNSTGHGCTDILFIAG